MAAIDIDGGVPATTLSSSITSGDTSIPLADGTGYPDGGSGNFYIVIDKGLSTQEVIECSARAGTTVTAATRGADGSTATAHASGAAVEHVVPASELQVLSTHAAATTGTPHGSAYLTTTSHASISHDASMLAAGAVTNVKVASGIDAAKLTGTASVDTTGNAATATTAAAWTTARDLSFTGDVTGTGSVNGSANVATALTIATDAVDETMIAVGAWTAYTPTWTGASSNPAIGNGTIAGAFLELGKLLFFRAHIVMGSTTTYGSGDWILTLPSGKTAVTQYETASAFLRDSGTTVQAGSCKFQNADLNTFKVATADNFSDVSTPWTWANGDELIVTGSIEIA